MGLKNNPIDPNKKVRKLVSAKVIYKFKIFGFIICRMLFES